MQYREVSWVVCVRTCVLVCVVCAGVVYLDCQLLHCHANGKAHVTAAGLLGLMLKMLHTTPPSTHTACACQGLYALCIGDVDMQNEVRTSHAARAPDLSPHGTQLHIPAHTPKATVGRIDHTTYARMTYWLVTVNCQGLYGPPPCVYSALPCVVLCVDR